MKIPSRLANEINQKYAVERETFKRAVKDNQKDAIEVEIGDSKQDDFKPQMKLMRWGNEGNFSIRAEEHPDATVRTSKNKIIYGTPEYEVHFYDLDPSEIGEDGGLEMEWLLPKKPKNNVLKATIQSKDLDFFYQAELTDEEVLRSLPRELPEGKTLDEIKAEMRPANVIGSYAVYHKTNRNNRIGGKEYKTGKVCHIYRPKAIDARGKETWCKLLIENGEVSVTVPEDFLRTAKYPVLVDPTFGYSSVGASFINLEASCCGGDTYLYDGGILGTLSENGDISSISFYAKRNGASGGSGTVAGSIHAGSAGSITWPTALATGTSESVNSSTASWIASTVTYSATTGTYWVLANVQTNSSTYPISFPMQLAYDTGGTTNEGFQQGDIITLFDDYLRSIYATYTATGGGGGSTFKPISSGFF